MDAQETVIGVERGLRFELRWLEEAAGGNAAEATRGELKAWIADTLVWGAEDGGHLRGLAWSWVEVLEHLARAWPYLEWEQVNPAEIDVLPDKLRAVAEEEWAELSPERRDTQERELYEFEEAHNLAAGLQGLYAAPLWIQRSGDSAWVIGAGVRAFRPFAETVGTLEAFGEAIFARLRSIKRDPRARMVMERWRRRRDLDIADYVSLATGLKHETIDGLVGRRGAQRTFSLHRVGQENEILAAARMIGTSLPADTLRGIFDRIKREKHRATPELDQLTSRAMAVLDEVSNDLPHDQGTALAQWLREELGIPAAKRVDPRKVLERWNVSMVELDLHTGSLDAVACWGPQHGPTVFVNTSGRHCRSRAGRNATLAHEICHLLVDRRRSLPLGEVMGGRMPPVVEPRARAFAAELLVPKSAAADIAGVAPDELPGAVIRLAKKYEASQELVAWRVRNSGASIAASQIAYLRSLVSDPGRF